MKHLFEKTCKQCNKIFVVEKHRKDTAFFCSVPCKSRFSNSGNKSHLWKGGKKENICAHCKGVFFAVPNLHRVYCSKKCHDEARMKRETKTCTNCGATFERKASHANRYPREYCSFACYIKYAVGDKSAQWRGGNKDYPKTFNRQFKNMIRERDNHTCAICKEWGDNVHHINYVKNDTTPENCITLCRSCHAKTNSNREYWIEYFSS